MKRGGATFNYDPEIRSRINSPYINGMMRREEVAGTVSRMRRFKKLVEESRQTEAARQVKEEVLKGKAKYITVMHEEPALKETEKPAKLTTYQKLQMLKRLKQKPIHSFSFERAA